MEKLLNEEPIKNFVRIVAIMQALLMTRSVIAFDVDNNLRTLFVDDTCALQIAFSIQSRGL